MIATYRLQLTPDFTFADAEAQIPYLADLGVSHLYLSPITEAPDDSTHGYDAIDLGAVRSAFGGREGFESLRAAAVEAGLGLLLDFVPNHMGVHPHNERWQHVLAFGPHARPAFFDVDWNAGDGKVRLPFLGTSYGEALEGGELAVTYERERLFATYYDHRFALRPDTYADVLEAALPEATAAGDLLAAYRTLGPGDAEQAQALRPQLNALNEEVGLNEAFDGLSPDDLHGLFEQQHWRLAHWRTSMAELNYRRFFQINDLAALRQEDDAVFEDTHALLAELAAEEGVDGVRVDHVDGLTDPQNYLEHLRDDLGIAQVWVEKILTGDEVLPDAWPVEGTSGYEFMNDALHVLTDPTGARALTETYQALVPGAASFHDEERTGRLDVMQTTLAADRHLLTDALAALAAADYHTRDLDRPTLDAALTELTAAFERYRTYVTHDPEGAKAVLDEVIARARKAHPFPDRDPYGFIKRVVLGRVHEDLRDDARAWALRFQQFTAPVAAKGVEDAAFYRYNRLVALCEVGGTPQRVGLAPPAFHARCTYRAEHHPHTLLTTATHDHKRGEDTRMRLATLAEHPDDWRAAAEHLTALAEDHGATPHAADAYLFYQVLAALWAERDTDDFADRLATYVEKAFRESSRGTRWTDPNADYEETAEAFVRRLAAAPEALGALPAQMAADGFRNTLTQLLLKCTTPGVPDFYQGRALLDLSLVDPDNRRPVDYDHRRALLADLQPLLDAPSAHAETLRDWVSAQDERAKLFFTARLLRLRRTHEMLFSEGRHLGLSPSGSGSDVWLAFARTHRGDTPGDTPGATPPVLVVAPRFPARWRTDHDATLALPDVFGGHALTDTLTGRPVEADGGVLDLNALPLPWAVVVRRDS